jgi:imidazolonepropionase-like amidohydrolase
MSRVKRTLALLLLAAAACSSHLSDGVVHSHELVLQNVTLIDGTGAEPRQGVDVMIANGRIAAIGPGGSIRVPSGARTLDLTGRYLLPGLIDTHAHVTVLRMQRDPSNRVVGSSFDAESSRRALELLLEHGVTAVRNPGAPAAEGVALRDSVSRGEIPGPRIVTAGDIIASSRLTEEEARAEVRRQAALGVDLIKIYAAIRPPVARAVIEEAHALDLRVVGHLQQTTWTEAVRMGIDSITHGSPWSRQYLPEGRREEYRETILGRLDWLEWVDLDGPEIDEMIALLVQHGTPGDPTLIAYHTKHFGNDPRYTQSIHLELMPELAEEWRRGTFVDDWSRDDFARGARLWPKLAGLVRRYHAAGVILAAGSDTPNPWVVPGISLHQELELLVDAGIPTLDVITIATRNGAEVLGMSNDIGTIETGKHADLIVLSADPITDIRNTRAIELVLLAGRIAVDRR